MSTRRKGSTVEDLVLVIGTIICGLILVLTLYKSFTSGGTTPDAIISSAADDITAYIYTLSTVDAGVKTLDLPAKVSISIQPNSLRISYKGSEYITKIPAEVQPNDIETDNVCIVKKSIEGIGIIIICDARDSICCTPEIR